ncbi:MAG: sugar phosphate isomerase/epimerase family protein [Desulfurococcaceae archaeon]
MYGFRYSVGLWIFGVLADRFSTYKPSKTLEEKFAEVSKVNGLRGVEMIYPAEFKYDEIDKVKALLKEYNLGVSGILVELFTDPKWIYGSLTSKDEKIRKEAIKVATQSIDVVKELGGDTISLWLGHDGYDYPLQVDYNKKWDMLVDGIREIASHDANVKIGVEYKLKEPRTHIFVGTVGKALMLVNEVGLKNVGVTFDLGHALYAGESPAESICLLSRHGKLFHVHFNDNYRDWDHDMIVGSVNLWDVLETIYWLKRINYNGWIALDLYPYRENVAKACERSIENIELMLKLIDKIGAENLEKCLESEDATEIAAILRRVFV